jgi:hypothetical protein
VAPEKVVCVTVRKLESTVGVLLKRNGICVTVQKLESGVALYVGVPTNISEVHH